MCKHLKLTLAIAAVLAVGGATLALALPTDRDAKAAVAAPVPHDEHARTIAAMRPTKRARPVVAVLGHNDGTETTDYVIPYAVLAESGAADVLAVAPEAGTIKLRPALALEAQATLAAFDTRHPDGADYVVVAAMHPRNDPRVLAWINAQKAKGAIIVGVCSGVRTLSAAGLLAGRAATRYWYDAEDMEEANPTTRWIPDRRYVVDRGVVTTTGITASLPVSLALVEAIAGTERAAAVAKRFGVDHWDARHDSDAFGFDRGMLAAALKNKAAPWRRDVFGVPVEEGVDELSLAFTADALSRTFRSTAVSVAGHEGTIRTRRGLLLVPDRVGDAKDVTHTLAPPMRHAPATALTAALGDIQVRYGDDTAAFVATQLEYAWSGDGADTQSALALHAPVGHHARTK